MEGGRGEGDKEKRRGEEDGKKGRRERRKIRGTGKVEKKKESSFCPLGSCRISLILLPNKCLFTQKYLSYFIPKRI